MKISRLTALALAPLLLAACADDAERTAEMADSIRAGTDVNAGQSLSADTVGVAATDGIQAAVVLNEVGGSGVSGQATLVPGDGAQTEVSVTLNAAASDGGTHQGHIHEGRCDAIGSVVAPLEPVTVSGGTGTSASTIDLDAMSVMDDAHIVLYHQAGGEPGSPAACGEIPGHLM